MKIDIDHIALNTLIRIIYDQTWVSSNFKDSLKIFTIVKNYKLEKYYQIILDDLKSNISLEEAHSYFQQEEFEPEVLEIILKYLSTNINHLKIEDFEFKDILKIYKSDQITEFILKWVKENELNMNEKKEIVTRYLKYRPFLFHSFYSKNLSSFSDQVFEKIFNIIDQ